MDSFSTPEARSSREVTAVDSPPPRKPVTRSDLVVRVGVSGHRDLPAEQTDRLKKEVREVLHRIAVITEGIFNRRQEAGFELYSDAPHALRMISPLAEGADRIVAEQALEEGYTLQCPLPFPREEYEEDFRSKPGHPQDTRDDFREILQRAEGNILELDGGSKNEAYEAVGRLVLRQCDILITLWDPEREEKAGGTRQIVRESLGLEIPTVWISVNEKVAPSLLSSVDPPKTEALSLLEKRLMMMFLFSADTVGDDRSEETGKRTGKERCGKEILAANRFLDEEPPDQDYGVLFRAFRDVWCWSPGNKRPAHSETHIDWQPLFGNNQEFRRRIKTNYDWADCLANHYGGLYRSSFIATYCMGALAILAAFLGFYFERSDWRYFYFAVELLLILSIFSLTGAGRREGWHQRWMDYRLFAESLRQLQFLAPLGRVTLSFKVPAHLQPSDPRNSWFNWYFRALVREGGMIRGKFEPSYLQICKDGLLAAICGQIRYHHDNHKTLKVFSKRLHWIAQLLFGVAAFACLLHIKHWDRGTVPSLAVNFATIALPAFGAALAAIFHHGEFERLSLRSEALTERLTHLRNELRQRDLSSRELGDAAEIFSEVMSAELLDWRFAFLEKNLQLPA